MSEIDKELESQNADQEKKPENAGETPQEGDSKPEIDADIQKKLVIKENLDKAIRESNEILKAVRKAKKETKTEEEEELPRIDMNDPGSKAWNRHIQSQVAPVQESLDREKEEIFNYAYKEFIKDKPILVNNAERRKSFLEKYDRLKNSSGRTKEGVLDDLEVAFGAEFSSELRRQAEQKRIESAEAEALFSEPAISRGSSSSYQNEGDKKIILSEEDKIQLQKWNMTPKEYAELVKKYK